MIKTREQLIHTLTEAAEVEHNLLCSYLYATFSMKRAGEGGLDEAQSEAVESWRTTVLTIALEEMAHLACVNNLLIAVGGAPHFDRPNFPVAPGYHPSDIVVRLTPFDEATLDHFIYLERPHSLEIEDGEGFVAKGVARETVVDGLAPSAQDYPSVGALYDSLADGFRALSAELGEKNLIDPIGRCQLDSGMIRLPNIPRITCLDDALSTIRHIKEEGEGATASETESHFDRFQQIKAEWTALREKDSDFEPAWPAAHDPVMRRPADEASRVWVTEPEAAACLDLANAAYGTMLSVLVQAFGGSDPADKLVLMRASVELMEASASLASQLARMPANPDRPGINAGITFAVPRNSGYRPLERRARLIFRERVAELLDGARQMPERETTEKVIRRLGNAAALLEGSMEPD